MAYKQRNWKQSLVPLDLRVEKFNKKRKNQGPQNQITTGSPRESGLKLLVLEITPSNKTVTGGADLVTLDTRIQGRIRVHTRTRGHDLWKPLDIKEVWEYINKSPWCKALSITDSHTLYHTIIHFVKERNSTSSQCSDCQSPTRPRRCTTLAWYSTNRISSPPMEQSTDTTA